MHKVEFSDEAKNEYIEIWEYIWEDNLYYANEVLNKIDSTISTILLFPFIWKEVEKWYRKIIEPTYKFKIIYKIIWDVIYIVSIFRYRNYWN
jgi:plasmid stabilization system protein ParE